MPCPPLHPYPPTRRLRRSGQATTPKVCCPMASSSPSAHHWMMLQQRPACWSTLSSTWVQVCAMPRAAMLGGATAVQLCTQQSLPGWWQAEGWLDARIPAACSWCLCRCGAAALPAGVGADVAQPDSPSLPGPGIHGGGAGTPRTYPDAGNTAGNPTSVGCPAPPAAVVTLLRLPAVRIWDASWTCGISK